MPWKKSRDIQCDDKVVELWSDGELIPYPRCSVHWFPFFATSTVYSLSIVNTSPTFASCRYTHAGFFGHTLLPVASPAAGVASHGSPSTATRLQTAHPAPPGEQPPLPAAIAGVAVSAADTMVEVYGPSASCGGLFGEKNFPATHTVSVFPETKVVRSEEHTSELQSLTNIV